MCLGECFLWLTRPSLALNCRLQVEQVNVMESAGGQMVLAVNSALSKVCRNCREGNNSLYNLGFFYFRSKNFATVQLSSFHLIDFLNMFDVCLVIHGSR